MSPIDLIPAASSPIVRSQAPVVATAPTVLYRLDLGHWHSCRDHEASGSSRNPVPQPVSALRAVPSRQVWNGDRWVAVPGHFVGTEISQ